MKLKESKFKFEKPILKRFSFNENEAFEKKEELKMEIEISKKESFIRQILKERNMSALSRKEAYEIVGITNDFQEEDPRMFYTSFIERKNNTDARRRLQAPGPKRTLEDLYIQFIFETAMPLI